MKSIIFSIIFVLFALSSLSYAEFIQVQLKTASPIKNARDMTKNFNYEKATVRDVGNLYCDLLGIQSEHPDLKVADGLNGKQFYLDNTIKHEGIRQGQTLYVTC